MVDLRSFLENDMSQGKINEKSCRKVSKFDSPFIGDDKSQNDEIQNESFSL